MQQVNINVVARELDPSKAYIVEVKADMHPETRRGLVNALQQLKIKHVLVATREGDDINVVEVPEEVK